MLNRSQPSRQIIEDEVELTQNQIEANQLVSQAEILAKNLDHAKILIAENFYSNWKVDNLVNQLLSNCEKEINKASELDFQAQKRINETLAKIGFNLILSLSIAFAILVVSDFLKAFLNLSRNSDLIEKLITSANNPQTGKSFVQDLSSKQDEESQI